MDMSTRPFVLINDRNISLDAIDLYDLYSKISDYEIDYIGEMTSSKRVLVKTRLSDNLLNHVLLGCGINYTSGYPVDLLRGVSEEHKKRVGESGIGGVWWFICASLLASDVESFDETMRFLVEVKNWIIEGKIGDIIVPFIQGFKDYDKYLNIITEDVPITPQDFDMLSSVVETCYEDYYSAYWEEICSTLSRRCEALERIENGIGCLDYLEYLTNRRFPTDHLKVFLVDAFRDGGGIYGAYPNRIIMCSGRDTAFVIHVGIAHEGGHLVCRGWESEPEAAEVMQVINRNAGKDLRKTIEEHAMALIQLKMDEHFIKKRRITHGYMGNRFFKILEDYWDEWICKSDRKMSDFIAKAILEASKDAQTMEEMKKLT